MPSTLFDIQKCIQEGEADATITIDQLNQALGTHVEPNSVDTVGGIVYQNLAHMPRMGDSIVEENPCHNRSFRFGQACNAR